MGFIRKIIWTFVTVPLDNQWRTKLLGQERQTTFPFPGETADITKGQGWNQPPGHPNRYSWKKTPKETSKLVRTRKCHEQLIEIPSSMRDHMGSPKGNMGSKSGAGAELALAVSLLASLPLPVDVKSAFSPTTASWMQGVESQDSKWLFICKILLSHSDRFLGVWQCISKVKNIWISCPSS